MPFRRSSAFQPQEVMDDIEFCWCGSGKSWGKCHRDRAKAKPVHVEVGLKRIAAEQAKGYCTHPDASPSACSGRPTFAHTVQKEGGLRAIAENGHVTSVKKAALGIAKNNGQLVAVPDGVNRASTFPGFCNAHDAAFSPAEQTIVPLVAQTAFLLSYRAVAYERLMKEAALRANAANRLDVDNGRPFADQARLQSLLFAEKQQIELSLRDTVKIGARFDAAFRSPTCSGFSYLLVEFDAVLPAVTSAAFFPEVDMFGGRLQHLGSTDALDLLAFNLTVLNGRTILVLGWLTGTVAPSAFAASFARLPDAEKSNAAVRLGIEWFENTYVRPSWWAVQPPTVTETLLASMGTLDAPPVCRRGADGRCLDGVVVASAAVLQMIGPLDC